MPEVVNTTPLASFEMLPDDSDRETMVAVDGVSMVFNMASEQLNSLKEYAIALARKELRFKEFRALDDITLDIKKGDVFGILGTNGSGKSTLLKIIAGVLEPTTGTCTINGNIAPLIELGAGFDMELTARENIFLNGALLGYSKKFIQDNFDDIVEFAEIGQFLDMPLKNYSSGMVARIAFAIATVIVPDILIVDEVLSVGDFMFQKKCEERIQSLIKEHNVTVLIVSHNNDQIERLCNKAVWIEKGHMRMLGTAASVCQTYRVLGGHVGSKASEERVFRTLTKKTKVDESSFGEIVADSRYGVAAKLVERCYPGTPASVIVVSGENDVDPLFVSGLAGALDAPILLAQDESIPDATSQELKRLGAADVVFVGLNDTNISANVESMLKEATGQDYRMTFLTAGTYAELSEVVFEFGRQRGIWGSTAVCTYIGCTGDLISLSPFTHAQHCPVFLKESEAPVREGLSRTLSAAGFYRMVVLGGQASFPEASLDAFERAGLAIVRFCADGPYEANGLICEWIRENGGMRPESMTLLISSIWNPSDAYVACIYASKHSCLIVLEDPQNLDSVARAIDYIDANRQAVSDLVFIGDRIRFSRLDKELLAKCLVAEGEASS